MAVSAKWYPLTLKGIFSGALAVDWDNDTIKCALAAAGYSPDQDTHDFFNDITNELPTENGYTAGGLTLACSAPSYDTASNEVRLDAGDAAWSVVTAAISARYGIIYKSTGTASTSPLLGYVDLGATATIPAGGKFTLEWDSTGILKLPA